MILRNKVRFALLHLIAAMTPVVCLAACDSAPNPSVSSACRSMGLCDEPSLPPVRIEVLCDASDGSSCSRTTLDKTLDDALRYAADRPGSTVRLWLLGRDVSTTSVVAEQISPKATPGSTKVKRAARDRFVKNAKEVFLSGAAPTLDAAPIRRSPLAEAITKITMAGDPDLPRRLLVITDGREVSVIGDLECAALPKDTAFLASLKRQQVLAPGLLSGVDVEFVFVNFKPAPTRGCAVSIERELRVHALWKSALRLAGASDVRLSSGPAAFKADSEDEPSGPEGRSP